MPTLIFSQTWQDLTLLVTRYTPATLQTSRTTTIVVDEEPYYRLSFTVQGRHRILDVQRERLSATTNDEQHP